MATTNQALLARTVGSVANVYALADYIDARAAAGYTLPVASASVLGGVKAGAGVNISGAGVLTVTTIIPPTSDPLVAGALWNNAGTLTISAG